MKIVVPSYAIEYPSPAEASMILRRLEVIARTCYKSEARITDESAPRFVQMLRDRGHNAMLEHDFMRVKFICDRGVSHELVRHRLASFAQESTRYCDYESDGIQVICPESISKGESPEIYESWAAAVKAAEDCYKELREKGVLPQIARSVLPTCLKTEIWVTANLKEWRHIFRMRTPKSAHPQMRELMIPLLKDAKELIPVIFDDIQED